jgi:hypothetical protein
MGWPCAKSDGAIDPTATHTASARSHLCDALLPDIVGEALTTPTHVAATFLTELSVTNFLMNMANK